MRFPLMLRRTHDALMDEVAAEANEAIRDEYKRAWNDGRAQVRLWAVNASSELFLSDGSKAKGLALTAFQDIIAQFKPEHRPYSYGRRERI